MSTRSAYILFYQRRNAIPAWSASSAARGERNRPSRGTSRPPARCHRPGGAREPPGHARGHRTDRHVCEHGMVCTCMLAPGAVSPRAASCARLHAAGCLHTLHTCLKLQLHSADGSVWSHLAHTCAHPHTCTQLLAAPTLLQPHEQPPALLPGVLNPPGAAGGTGAGAGTVQPSHRARPRPRSQCPAPRRLHQLAPVRSLGGPAGRQQAGQRRVTAPCPPSLPAQHPGHQHRPGER